MRLPLILLTLATALWGNAWAQSPTLIGSKPLLERPLARGLVISRKFGKFVNYTDVEGKPGKAILGRSAGDNISPSRNENIYYEKKQKNSAVSSDVPYVGSFKGEK